MHRLIVSTSVTLALAAVPAGAQDKAAEPAFKLRCASTSTQMLPKGNAGAGKIEFRVEVDPAGQSVMLDGQKRPAKIDKDEVVFSGGDDAAISISRSMKRFGVIAPIKGVPAEDSRKYLYYRGECKAV